MPQSPFPSRRTLLTGAGLSGVGAVGALGASSAGAAPLPVKKPTKAPIPGKASMIDVPYEQRDTVRIGLIGLGARGSSMAAGWAAVPGTSLDAVCDIRADRATRTADALEKEGHPRPREFGGADTSFQEMLDAVELDLVYIATPWEFHYAHGKASLEAGANVVVELPVACEVDELWDLVATSEKTGRHLSLSENTCYGRNELAMMRAAHAGLFGDLTNGHGAYLHDLRALMFDENYYTDHWRRTWHTTHNRSFYAMHGLGPVANAMDINRGDRITTIRATATAPRALADYRERFMPADHPSWEDTYIKGDLITCLHDTELGRVIRTEHDVSSPRPYSRINSIAGTRGVFEDYVPVGESGARIYTEPDHGDDAWRPFDSYREEFDHWLWRTVGDDAEQSGGHGGIDYLLQWRFVQCIRLGLVPDIDVYDSATWCAPVPLSEESINQGGAVLEMPDFTRGRWSEVRQGMDSHEKEMP
ncbi:Gfo/Idh/MocA family protein [Brachybacterium sp. AOP3-A1-3]|uniref:Gfo/Idh/MocA family protein n=1 Tax=Brachybacterium sp. AOP3-A1-3 TaxID=3457699 RepID=UPI0040341D59